jgi:hypothetical protein
VQPFGGPGERVRISADGGVQARWRPDGGELFYLTLGGRLIAVPMALRPDGRTLRPGAGVVLFQARVGAVLGTSLHSYIVAPDGQRFLVDTVIEQTPAPISHLERQAAGRVGAKLPPQVPKRIAVDTVACIRGSRLSGCASRSEAAGACRPMPNGARWRSAMAESATIRLTRVERRSPP